MEQFNIYEAKSRLSELVNAAAQGAEFILARNGKPLARLVPFHQPGKESAWQGRGFGSQPDLGAIPDDFDSPLSPAELALFEDTHL